MPVGLYSGISVLVFSMTNYVRVFNQTPIIKIGQTNWQVRCESPGGRLHLVPIVCFLRVLFPVSSLASLHHVRISYNRRAYSICPYQTEGSCMHWVV